MFNVGNFLEKFRNIAPPERFIKEVFIKTTLDIVGIKIKDSDIKITRDIIYVSTNSIVKNEIFFKKQEILERVNKELIAHKKTIKNII